MPTKDQLTGMERVSVQLTSNAKQQIVQWAIDANIKPGYFMSLALTVGARALARQLNPEQFMTSNVWQAVMQGMASSPEIMAQLGDEGAVSLNQALSDPEKMKEVLSKLEQPEA
jgi:type II secretory pathway component PulC